MWFLHYRSNFLVALLHYMVPQVLFSVSLEVSGQDKAAGQHLAKHLLSCASRPRLLTGLLLPELGAPAPRHAGRGCGRCTPPKNRSAVWGETTARARISQADFSLASLKRREDAEQDTGLDAGADRQQAAPMEAHAVMSSLQLAPN